jgi:hypothetical protein
MIYAKSGPARQTHVDIQEKARNYCERAIRNQLREYMYSIREAGVKRKVNLPLPLEKYWIRSFPRFHDQTYSTKVSAANTSLGHVM